MLWRFFVRDEFDSNYLQQSWDHHKDYSTDSCPIQMGDSLRHAGMRWLLQEVNVGAQES